MDAYIISLKNPIELINKIKEFNINPILVKGVKGIELSTEEIEYNTNNTLFSQINPKSSLGCAMSHLKSWRQFLSSNQNVALFLEDDAIFENNFRQDLNDVLNNTPNNFDILYLGCFFCDKNYNSFTKYVNKNFGKNNEEIIINDYIKIPQIFFGAHSYILSRKGALKLLELLEKNVYYQIDYLILQEFYKDNINVYCTRKRLAYQTSSSNITASENVYSNHPIILDLMLKSYELDKHVSVNFFKNLSIFRIGNINFNIISILFFIIGIIMLLFRKIDIKMLIIIFVIISAYDLFMFKDLFMVFFNGSLLIAPSLLKTYLIL
jgi:GR25 family glycosyltransferase involved in LPS biosynthesis